jgi:hypothetical protein
MCQAKLCSTYCVARALRVPAQGRLQCSQSAGLLPPVAESRVAKPSITTRQGWDQSMQQTSSCCNATANEHASCKALQHLICCYSARGTSTGSVPVQPISWSAATCCREQGCNNDVLRQSGFRVVACSSGACCSVSSCNAIIDKYTPRKALQIQSKLWL